MRCGDNSWCFGVDGQGLALAGRPTASSRASFGGEALHSCKPSVAITIDGPQGVKYEQPEAEETDADSSAAGGEASAQASDDSEEEDVAVDNLFGSDDDDDSF